MTTLMTPDELSPPIRWGKCAMAAPSDVHHYVFRHCSPDAKMPPPAAPPLMPLRHDVSMLIFTLILSPLSFCPPPCRRHATPPMPTGEFCLSERAPFYCAAAADAPPRPIFSFSPLPPPDCARKFERHARGADAALYVRRHAGKRKPPVRAAICAMRTPAQRNAAMRADSAARVC